MRRYPHHNIFTKKYPSAKHRRKAINEYFEKTKSLLVKSVVEQIKAGESKDTQPEQNAA